MCGISGLIENETSEDHQCPEFCQTHDLTGLKNGDKAGFYDAGRKWFVPRQCPVMQASFFFLPLWGQKEGKMLQTIKVSKPVDERAIPDSQLHGVAVRRISF